MKRPKRTTILVIAMFAIPLFLLWISWGGGLVPQVYLLNKAMREDPALADYPYQFRAVLLASGLATVTRPYSVDVPPTLFLAVVNPELANKAPDDPTVAAAIAELKRHEQIATEIIVSHPEADTVEWVLDRAWYHKNGIELPPYVRD